MRTKPTRNPQTLRRRLGQLCRECLILQGECSPFLGGCSGTPNGSPLRPYAPPGLTYRPVLLGAKSPHGFPICSHFGCSPLIVEAALCAAGSRQVRALGAEAALCAAGSRQARAIGAEAMSELWGPVCSKANNLLQRAADAMQASALLLEQAASAAGAEAHALASEPEPVSRPEPKTMPKNR